MFGVRFWNEANECIMFDFGPWLYFSSEDEAFKGAEAFMLKAVEAGAVEMSINDDFYEIESDEEGEEEEEEDIDWAYEEWIDFKEREMWESGHGWD